MARLPLTTDNPDAPAISKRVGRVLLVVGFIDVAVMIYCIVEQLSYRSSLNIFACAAGIFLMRGSLRTAQMVRGFTAIFLSASIGLFAYFLFVTPFQLVALWTRLNPALAVLWVSVIAALLGVLAWVHRQLGQLRLPPISRVPWLPRVAPITVFVVAGLVYFGSGTKRERAISEAAVRIGPGYQYAVTGLTWRHMNGSGTVHATVVAYDDKSIQSLQIDWSE